MSLQTVSLKFNLPIKNEHRPMFTVLHPQQFVTRKTPLLPSEHLHQHDDTPIPSPEDDVPVSSEPDQDPTPAPPGPVRYLSTSDKT